MGPKKLGFKFMDSTVIFKNVPESAFSYYYRKDRLFVVKAYIGPPADLRRSSANSEKTLAVLRPRQVVGCLSCQL